MKIKWYKDKQLMNVNQKNGVTWLTYPAFEKIPGIVHGFSTRLGGVSQGIYESMNLSFTRGDNEDVVRENYRRLSDAMGFSMGDIVTSDQTHTTNVHVVTETDRGNGITKPRPYTDVDGMITNVPGLVLATFYADCVPVFFYDPVKEVVAMNHSGWRGTVKNISRHMVEALNKEYGCEASDLICAVGPSICQNCYEVSEDVAEAFKDAYLPEQYMKMTKNIGNGKYLLDLHRANYYNLTGAGILPEHINVTDICTCCNPDFLFSHRASHGKRGNLGAVIMLKSTADGGNVNE